MAVSSGTRSLVLSLPSSSHTSLAFSFHTSKVYRPRLLNLRSPRSLPSLQAEEASNVGFIQDSEGEDDSTEDWQVEILDELDPLLYLHSRKQRKSRGQRRKSTSRSSNHSDAPTVATSNIADWAEQARERAFLSVEARNPMSVSFLKNKIEPKLDVKNQKKKKKKKNEFTGPLDVLKRSLARMAEDAAQMEDDASLDAINNIEDLPFGLDDDLRAGDMNTHHKDLGTWQMNTRQNLLIFSPEAPKSSEQVNERERIFNRRLVNAKTAQAVLEIVGTAEERMRKLGFPSLLTPLNAATALHRIAKHMETSGTPKNDRLAFARKRYMAELVGKTMEVLSGCSAQGLSNIAWALSKVGGSILYFSEMDLIAKTGLTKVLDFNAQNVANTLGSFASMQHAAPNLFESLSNHACDILDSFNPQELAQVLWAHAEVSQQAAPLLDALDSLLKKASSRSPDHPNRSNLETLPSCDFAGIRPFSNASPEHLANIAWSYAVLNEISRPCFEYLWQMLESILGQNGNRKNDLRTWHLSQIHQVNLCLHYEYPQYGSTLRPLTKDLAAEAWEKHKASIRSTSAYHKDVKWYLVSTGQKWVAEYTAADYSLDLALVEEKTAIEIDGPSHFIRNTGSPLGHTLLKKRLLSRAGWRVLTISYEMWEELDGEEQMNFLKELLKSSA